MNFNLNKMCQDPESFNNSLSGVKEDILSNFQSRQEIINVLVEDQTIQMTKGRFLVNLFMLKPLVNCVNDFKVEFADLYQFDIINEKNLNTYFNRIIKQSRVRGTNTNDIRECIYDAINEISDISGQLNVLFGNTFSFRDFIRLSVEDPEADKLFNNIDIEYGLQFNEIEKKFSEYGKQLEGLFKRHPESELYPFISAATGINRKQMAQAIGFVGLKPDINGEVIPVCIKDNYLNGLTNIENYLINCKGTRKALITNYKQVR